MADVVLVKVLCGSCGRLICRIVDTPDYGAVYAPVGENQPVRFDARTVACPRHGVPDLDPSSGKLAGADEHVVRARADGKVRTFRAHVSRTWIRGVNR